MLEFLERIFNVIEDISNSIINGLKELFIPSEDYFNEKLSQLEEKMSSKFGVFTDLLNILKAFYNSLTSNATSSVPKFEFTYRGATYNIMNLEIFEDYIVIFKNIIIFTTYYFFIKRLIKKAPSLIRGGGGV